MSDPQQTDHLRSPWLVSEREGLQKFDLRLFVDVDEGLDLDAVSDRLLVVFGRWRLEEGDEIIDLADYTHVPNGPGVLLVSHRWHLGIHWAGGEPALFYSSRKGLQGSVAERLAQALRGLFEKSGRLLAEEELAGAVRPRCGDLEIVVNDRVGHPNTEETDAAIRPAVEEIAARLFPGEAPSIDREPDPRRRLGYRVRARDAAAGRLADLAGRL